MIKKDKIIFLIRSYNEWQHLLDTIDIIKNEWFEKILIVDDGSTDGTYDNLVDRKDIYYLRHLINRWAWAALQTWFEFIKRFKDNLKVDYVVIFDPDWQHDIKDIYKFIEKFENNKDLDIVLWSRFVNNTYYNMPWHRKIILFLWKIFTLLVSNVNVTDPHNWYKMFKVNAIEKINLTLDWFEYASELIDQIVSNNLSYTEVPVNIKYTSYSLSKGQKSFNAINIWVKFLWNKFFKF